MSERPGLNIRFLAQGMLKLSPDQLPQDFFSWPRSEQIKWAQDFWRNRTREDLLEAVSYLCLEEDSVPDCLEVDGELNGEEYPVLAETPAWRAFNLINSQVLEEEEDKGSEKKTFEPRLPSQTSRGRYWG